jgi:release factor glutamine methyltransferase
MNHAWLRQHFYRILSPFYLQGELQSLYHWCALELMGWTRAVAYMHNDEEVDAKTLARWESVMERLKEMEPVQYIFNRAEFCGMSLFVDQHVLIPRPETEELVQLVLDMVPASKIRILDLGTGSGCIPLALKQARPAWSLAGADVSKAALDVARRNAHAQSTQIEWYEMDVLQGLPTASAWDVLVSNPPYVPSDLMESLEPNVRLFEPHLALFAPANDPFVFFKAIAHHAESSGVRMVFFETHATEMSLLCEALKERWQGAVSVYKDSAGKKRFVVLHKKNGSLNLNDPSSIVA